MTDLDALEKLAREATQAEWAWDGMTVDAEDGYVYVPECSYLGETAICLSHVYEGGGRDCAFIAAANPQAILALISTLRSRDAEVAGLRRALERQTEHIAAHAAARELLGMKARLTEAPRRPGSFACTSCNDTGMIAIRSRDGSYAFPGPVPDDARGYADADCWYCDCGRKP